MGVDINFFWKPPAFTSMSAFYEDGNIDYYARCEELGVDDDGSEVFDGRIADVQVGIARREAGEIRESLPE